MLRHASSATPDPSLHTVSHTSEATGHTAALPAELWKWRPGRSSCLYLTRRLQSVLNAVARLIYHLRTRDHITDALISLHWLWVLEQIQYKLAVLAMEPCIIAITQGSMVLAYKVLHGDTPLYLGPLIHIDNLPGLRPLCSTNTNHLVVPPVKL